MVEIGIRSSASGAMMVDEIGRRLFTQLDSQSTRASPRQAHQRASKLTYVRVRSCRYLNNIVEQDHRSIKRQTRPMLGFKSFWSAAVTLAGVELMHVIWKGQLLPRGELCPARQFYSLAE